MVDASYACHTDLKSHTGCTLHMAPNSASFLSLSKKQTILADSSTVAEYIGAHLAAKQILWARNILYEMNLSQVNPNTLYEDNKSTITLLNNPGNGNRTKHIALRYNFLREEIKNGTISMTYLPTDMMISDILTKPLGPTDFLRLRPYLLGM